MMAHSLTPSPPLPTPLLPRATKKSTATALPHLGFQPHCRNLQHGLVHARAEKSFAEPTPIDRRTLVWGLIGVGMSMNLSNQNANAARRPPPPPPKEKQDPNLSAIQLKILASKKRKEAMKEEVAKLREKGKSVN